MSDIGKKVRILSTTEDRSHGGYKGQIGEIVSEDKTSNGCRWFNVKMGDGKIIDPWAPEDSDAQCEWVTEEPDSNVENLIGRKVKIINPYSSQLDNCNTYGMKGEIGTVIAVESNELIVEFPNHGQKTVKIPSGSIHGEAEWYTEPDQSLHISQLKDRKVAIHTVTQEEWDKVLQIMEGAGIKWSNGNKATEPNTATKWSDYKERSCINTNGGKQLTYSHTPFYENEGDYQIVEASQFISANTEPVQDNQNTNNMQDKQQIQQQIDNLKKQLTELEESLKIPVYEKGQWVTCKPGYTDKDGQGDNVGGCGYKEGRVFQVDSIYSGHPYENQRGPVLNMKDDTGVYAYAVRLSTPEEIKAAQVTVIQIGSKKLDVKVSKTGIQADGKIVSVSSIEALIGQMRELGTGISGMLPWEVTLNTVKIGCVEEVTTKQLQDIVNAYNKINKL